MLALPPPDTLDLAGFPTWRPHQVPAILTALDAPTRFVALAVPTGVGKSLIAMALAQLGGPGTAILTATKGLQDQYARDYAQSSLDLRGMNNYRCVEAAGRFRHLFTGIGVRRAAESITCDLGPCLVGDVCEAKKGGCLYYDRVRQAIGADTVITNYAYWVNRRRAEIMQEGIAAAKGGGRVPARLTQRSLLLLDEAHDAPDQLGDQLAVTLHRRDLPLPPQSEVRSLAQWRAWATVTLKTLIRTWARARKLHTRLKAARLGLDLARMETMPEDWVVDRQADRVEVAPVTVSQYAETYLFAGAPKVVLLSATLTPETVRKLGIPDADVTWFRCPSPFPVERRPIYVITHSPPLRIDHRATPSLEAFWVHRMDRILAQRADRKGIVHTVSYRRQETIRAQSAHRDRMIVPRSARDLAQAVEQFKALPPESGAILLSPSVVTGWDFPGDQCEYQIVSKVPFPDTRTPIAKARAAADPEYRTAHAIRAMAQAIGRGMRSVSDQCETFVMDEHVRWVISRHRDQWPGWVLDAVRTLGMLPPCPPSLRQRKG